MGRSPARLARRSRPAGGGAGAGPRRRRERGRWNLLTAADHTTGNHRGAGACEPRRPRTLWADRPNALRTPEHENAIAPILLAAGLAGTTGCTPSRARSHARRGDHHPRRSGHGWPVLTRIPAIGSFATINFGASEPSSRTRPPRRRCSRSASSAWTSDRHPESQGFDFRTPPFAGAGSQERRWPARQASRSSGWCRPNPVLRWRSTRPWAREFLSAPSVSLTARAVGRVALGPPGYGEGGAVLKVSRSGRRGRGYSPAPLPGPPAPAPSTSLQLPRAAAAPGRCPPWRDRVPPRRPAAGRRGWRGRAGAPWRTAPAGGEREDRSAPSAGSRASWVGTSPRRRWGWAASRRCARRHLLVAEELAHPHRLRFLALHFPRCAAQRLQPGGDLVLGVPQRVRLLSRSVAGGPRLHLGSRAPGWARTGPALRSARDLLQQRPALAASRPVKRGARGVHLLAQRHRQRAALLLHLAVGARQGGLHLGERPRQLLRAPQEPGQLAARDEPAPLLRLQLLDAARYLVQLGAELGLVLAQGQGVVPRPLNLRARLGRRQRQRRAGAGDACQDSDEDRTPGSEPAPPVAASRGGAAARPGKLAGIGV